MRIRRFSVLVALLPITLLGCPKVVVTTSPRPGFSRPQVSPEEVAVVFLQPSRQAGTHAAIYEDGKFIGLVMDRTYFIHRTSPGTHRYMAVSEAADFLDAELNPGLVYLIRVKPRFGARYARFTLLPLSPRHDNWKDVPGWLAASREATPNAAGREWVRANANTVLELEGSYLPKWLTKPRRPALHPGDGVSPAAL